MAGLYWVECDEYIRGHEEKELSDLHYDDDEDGLCDECSAEIDYNLPEDCEHICHSDNWFMNFIWTIANFIHSLFGISPGCACGEPHYFK